MGFGVAIYSVEKKGNIVKFIFDDFSKGAEKIDNIKKKDVIGKNVEKVFPGAEKMGVINSWKKVLRTGKPDVLTMKAYKDSRLQVYRDNYSYLDNKGRIVAIYKDVTDRITVEDDLKEKIAQLEKVNNLMIGRELKMVELKKKIEKLEGKK